MTKESGPLEALITTAHVFPSEEAYTKNKAQVGPRDLFFMPFNPFPAGAIYMSLDPTNPAGLFGGEWGALNEGRVLLGAGAGYSAGSKGGAATHTLTISEMPRHAHAGSTSSSGNHYHFSWWSDAGKGKWGPSGDNAEGSWSWNSLQPEIFSSDAPGHAHSLTSNNAGSGFAHNNMQPYLSVYMWYCRKQRAATKTNTDDASPIITSLNTMHLFKSLSDVELNKERLKKGEFVLYPLSPFPVGSFYFSMDGKNPSAHFGGTWESIEEGRVLIGANNSYPAGSKGGSSSHMLSISEMPTHGHPTSPIQPGTHRHLSGLGSTWGKWGVSKTEKAYQSSTHVDGDNASSGMTNAGIHSHSGSLSSTGGNLAHENMQPYIAVNIWNRTA